MPENPIDAASPETIDALPLEKLLRLAKSRGHVSAWRYQGDRVRVTVKSGGFSLERDVARSLVLNLIRRRGSVPVTS